MDIAHDPENLGLAIPQGEDRSPDWGETVPIIPEGVVVDITDDPINQSGFYGDIYLGYHKGLSLKVVLKRPRNLSDQHIKRFFREGHTWTKLRQRPHPNILPFFGVTWSEKRIHLVSPYITNGTLDEYLSRLPDANRIELLRQAAGAVAHMHDLGIIHGDIKANNLLITTDSRVLLCDLGLAQIADLQLVKDAYSSAGCGNPRWASPELLEGAERSFMSDAWAFGMTIYQILSGKIPYSHLKGDYAPVTRVLKGELPEQLPTHSSAGISYSLVWDVATGCWSHEPTDRLELKEIAHRLRMAAITAERLLKSSTSAEPIDDQLNTLPQPGCADEDTYFAFSECVEIGPVMVGHHPDHDQVVLKPFRRSPLRRPNGQPRPDFQSELWTCLRHPYILPFLGICVLGPQLEPFMMSEYMEQGTILEYLESHSSANLSKMILQLASAVAYLHDEFIVHNGIRGENILISGNGRVLLAGLSSATVIGGHILRSDSPHSSSFRWSSPEYIQNGIQAFSSDVYSFGITLNEVCIDDHQQAHYLEINMQILTRQRPFDHTELEEEVKVLILDDQRPSQHRQSRYRYPLLAEVANTCWQTAANDRPTMRDVMENLEQSHVLLAQSEPGILVGQMNDVRCIALSPDGTRLVSGSGDSTLRIWEMAFGALVATIGGHTAPITGITFSPDGTKFASGSCDKTIRTWTESGNALVILAGHTNPISRIVYSLNGARLATTARDVTRSDDFEFYTTDDISVRIWDTASGSLLGTINERRRVNSIVFSPDGLTLVVSTWGLELSMKIWKIKEMSTGHSLNLVSDLYLEEEIPGPIAFSPDGGLLACAFKRRMILYTFGGSVPFQNSQLNLESITPPSVTCRCPPKTYQSSEVGFDEHWSTSCPWNEERGLEVICLGCGRTFPHRYSLQQHRKPWRDTIPCGTLNHMEPQQPGLNSIYLWDTTTWQMTTKLICENATQTIDALVFSPALQRLVAATQGGEVLSCDISSGRIEARLNTARRYHPLVLSQNGSWLAIGNREGTVEIWDLISETLVKRIEEVMQPRPWIHLLQDSESQSKVISQRHGAPFVISSDASRLASIPSNGIVRTWSVDWKRES